MSGDDSSSYAPRSPDLSSIFPAGPTPEEQPTLPISNYGNSFNHEHLHPSSAQNLNLNPHFYQQQQQQQQYSIPQPSSSPYGQHTQYVPPNTTFRPSTSTIPPGRAHETYQPPATRSQQAQPTSTGYSHPIHQPEYHFQHYETIHHYEAPGSQYRLGTTAEPFGFAQETNSTASFTKVQTMPPRRAPAPKIEEPIPIMQSPVKTKFPTARIKRIMQADEEVGKVAQQTPIAVGKALELFMVNLVSKSAEIAKEKGSKRVTASMLKQVVETDEQWDFLREIVGKVEAEKEGTRSKTKTETDSDDEASEPKKRGRGGRRKRAA